MQLVLYAGIIGFNLTFCCDDTDLESICAGRPMEDPICSEEYFNIAIKQLQKNKNARN
jgi:hypothetical protein